MELKSYQCKVVDNFEEYLIYVQEQKDLKIVFDKYWEDKIGLYNLFDGMGMQLYKNNIFNVVYVCIKVFIVGGKIFIVVNVLYFIFLVYDLRKFKVVVWLVFWSNFLQ